MDSVQLRKGDAIASNLVQAIRQSKISVIIFSANFASSKWCLQEVIEILKCKVEQNQIVYPIFYKVEPKHVRKQLDTIDETLAGHGLKFNDVHMERSQYALAVAATLSGSHMVVTGYEPDFIDDLVSYISNQVSDLTHLHVANYPVGTQPRMDVVIDGLSLEKRRVVRTIGIWGSSGIGKTTIAKVVYNSIEIASEFKYRCFLSDVSKNPSPDGLVKLQNILLSAISRGNASHITSIDKGISALQKILGKKKILLVLDDVSDLKQLEKLVGNPRWKFGSGSRIIITTTDRELLTNHGVHNNNTYEIEKLNDTEAELLFRNVSGGQPTEGVDTDFDGLVKEAVLYSDGIPLVLEVLGSRLRGKDINKMREALRGNIKSPMPQITEVLERSYDALGNSKRDVFLYIACFFKGFSKEYVINILQNCVLDPGFAIEVLVEKALIKILDDDTITMNNHVQEWGQIYARRRRGHLLWHDGDVRPVLEQNTGTDQIEGIMITDEIPSAIRLNTECFTKLKNLQVLIVHTNKICGDRVDYLPNNLRALDWRNCPLKSFPTDFTPNKIGIIEMHSARTFPVHNLQNMNLLKIIRLSGCVGLKEIPDMSGLTSLVELNLSNCEKLTKFEEKRINLTSVKIIRLSGCVGLKEIPDMSGLTSLVELNLSNCEKLKTFEEERINLTSLQYLNLSETAIKRFPCTKKHIDQNLPFSNSTSLHVDLSGCSKLEQVSEFPGNIGYLNLKNCPFLKRISRFDRILEGEESKMMRRMDLSNCKDLCDSLACNIIQKKRMEWDQLTEEEKKRMKKDPLRDQLTEEEKNLKALLSLFLSCRNSKFEVIFPTSAPVSKWFSCCMNFTTTEVACPKFCTSIEIPPNFNWEDGGLALSAQSLKECHSLSKLFRVHINEVCIRPHEGANHPSLQKMYPDHMWLYYIPFCTIMRPSDSVIMVRFEFKANWYGSDRLQMLRCGVQLVVPN